MAFTTWVPCRYIVIWKYAYRPHATIICKVGCMTQKIIFFSDITVINLTTLCKSNKNNKLYSSRKWLFLFVFDHYDKYCSLKSSLLGSIFNYKLPVSIHNEKIVKIKEQITQKLYHTTDTIFSLFTYFCSWKNECITCFH